MINFMCQLAWATGAPRYLVKHYPGCVWGTRLTLESVDFESPLSALSNSLKAWVERKGALSAGRFKVGHQSFPTLDMDLDWNIDHRLTWFSGLQTRTGTISYPGSLACWLQILGLLSLYNHVSQLHTPHTQSCYIHIYYIYIFYTYALQCSYVMRHRHPTHKKAPTKNQ